MSVWTAPITWTNAAVTAAQMNAEIRDHATWLKGFADLVTNSSAADTGTATYISITRASGTDAVLRGLVSGDTVARVTLSAAGALDFGPGNAASDVTLYRAAANILATDDVFRVDNTSGLTAIVSSNGYVMRGYTATSDSQPVIALGWDGTFPSLAAGSGVSTAPDVDLFRSAADTWKTNDGIYTLGGLVTKTKAGAPTDSDLVTGMQQSGAMILDTTNSRIYFRVGTTWKYAALT